MPHEQCEEAKRPRINPTLYTPSAEDMDEHTFAQPELVSTLCGGRGLGEMPLHMQEDPGALPTI